MKVKEREKQTILNSRCKGIARGKNWGREKPQGQNQFMHAIEKQKRLI
jgi:hypothetical protein